MLGTSGEDLARKERIRGQLTTVRIARVLEDLAALEDLAVPVAMETGGQTW
jgi:hypothetical protein